jgi:RNA polymerase sigma-70 factor, ECF subfamily
MSSSVRSASLAARLRNGRAASFPQRRCGRLRTSSRGRLPEPIPLDLSDDDFERLRADLSRALRRTCPAWLDSRRDDLVQTAMMRVLNVKKREDNVALNTSYLYRVAYAVVVDEMRRAQWRRESSLESAGPPEGPPAGPDEGPERRAMSSEIAAGIHDCLARLAPPRGLAVTLHLQGYSLAEAAQTLAWSFKRTENLVYRGLADLRACLSAKGLKP